MKSGRRAGIAIVSKTRGATTIGKSIGLMRAGRNGWKLVRLLLRLRASRIEETSRAFVRHSPLRTRLMTSRKGVFGTSTTRIPAQEHKLVQVRFCGNETESGAIAVARSCLGGPAREPQSMRTTSIQRIHRGCTRSGGLNSFCSRRP